MPRKYKNIRLRLLSQAVITSADCWEWQRRTDRHGYGRISVDNSAQLVHRISYIAFVGDPGDLLVCHKCDNRRCINPHHFFLGTIADNTRDMVQKGRNRSGTAGWVGRSGLIAEDRIISIRERSASGESHDAIAQSVGLSQTTVSQICRGDSYARIGGPVTRKKPRYRRIDNQTAEIILEMRINGASQNAIASAVGYSQAGVGKLLRRLSKD